MKPEDEVFARVALVVAAFCVWLTVRIINRRERWAKRLAFWIAAAYPISFLVYCVANVNGFGGGEAGMLIVRTFYRPLVSFVEAILK